MRLNITYVALLLSSALASSFNSQHREFSFGEQALVRCPDIPNSKKILFDCSKKEDTLKIKQVTLNPNPPKKGKKLEIKGTGYVEEDILPGAKLKIAVKLGLIKLIELNMDLCDTVHDYGLECPIKKGPLNVTTSVDLPSEIPMGTFIIDATATSKDKKELAHLLAKLHFSF